MADENVSTWLTTLNTIEKVKECVKPNFRKETQNDSKRFHRPFVDGRRNCRSRELLKKSNCTNTQRLKGEVSSRVDCMQVETRLY